MVEEPLPSLLQLYHGISAIKQVLLNLHSVVGCHTASSGQASSAQLSSGVFFFFFFFFFCFFCCCCHKRGPAGAIAAWPLLAADAIACRAACDARTTASISSASPQTSRKRCCSLLPETVAVCQIKFPMVVLSENGLGKCSCF
jgi:hypothetical protein